MPESAFPDPSRLGVSKGRDLAFCTRFAILFADLDGTEPCFSGRAKWVVLPKIDRDVFSGS